MSESQPPADLDALVEHTRGPQPLRRLFHAFNGCAVAGALTYLDLSRTVAALVLGGLLVGLMVLDVVRLRSDRINAAFFRAFTHLASPREARGPASSTWYAAGLLATVLLFPVPVAVSGILVLALADPAASYGGRRWGRRPFMGGTVEGTLIFAGVTLTLLLLRHPPLPAVVATGVAAIAERRSWPLDDNFTVPLVTGAVLTLLGAVG